MTYIIKFLNNNGKLEIYTGENIHRLNSYLEIIGSPTTLTTPGQPSHHVGPSFYTNNDTENLHPVISALHVQQKTICKFCGRIGHKDDAWITHVPNLLPQILIIKTNQFSTLHGDDTTDPPREWNTQPPAVRFKYLTSPPKVSTVVLSIMGRLNHHDVDNGDVEVYPSEYPF